MNNNIQTRKYIELFNELSKDETISDMKDRDAFNQLYGLCILDIELLMASNKEQLIQLYYNYSFGQIFSSDKENNTSRNTFTHFCEIIYELQDFIKKIIVLDENKCKSDEDIKKIFKDNIFNISKNNEKPYKTGIINFIQACTLKISNEELYSQTLLYFLNYDKDLSINFIAYVEPIGLKTTNILINNQDVNILFSNYTQHQDTVVNLLNNIFNIKNKEYNEQIYNFLYNRFFLSNMLLVNYIKICTFLFKDNTIDMNEFITKNSNKQFNDVFLSECNFTETIFVPCKGTNIGYYICKSSMSDAVVNYVNKICEYSNVKGGGYKKIKQNIKTTKNIRKTKNISKTRHIRKTKNIRKASNIRKTKNIRNIIN